MDTVTLKRILLIYNIVLMILSGIAILLGIVIFFTSFFISWLVPTSIGYSAIGGGVIVLVVAGLGYFACWDRGQDEKSLLPWHIAGLVIIIIIESYITVILMTNHTGIPFDIRSMDDPLGIVYNLFGGYKSIVHFFGKYLAFLAIILTIPQVIAIVVAVVILRAKPNLLPITVRFQR